MYGSRVPISSGFLPYHRSFMWYSLTTRSLGSRNTVAILRGEGGEGGCGVRAGPGGAITSASFGQDGVFETASSGNRGKIKKKKMLQAETSHGQTAAGKSS